MGERLGLVVAGAGLVGKRHAKAMRQVHDAHLLALVDPSENSNEFAEMMGVPLYANMEQMFAAQRPDGVILSTPTPLHVEQSFTCLQHDCPILIEKPIATSAKDAIAMVEEGERKGVPILVGHHRRHNPLIRAAHDIIASGRIGELRAVHANCWFYKPDSYFNTAPWRKKQGAGPISVNLVHDVDLIRYLCGEIVSVQALSSPSRRNYENEDLAAALLTLANGAIGTLSVSDSIVAPWSWELTSGEYPVYPKTAESCYMIGGSYASLSIPDLTVWAHKHTPDWWTPISAIKQPCDASDPLVNQLRHFVDLIKGNTIPLVSGREGVKTLQVIEAIQTAANSGQPVHIPQQGEKSGTATLA